MRRPIMPLITLMLVLASATRVPAASDAGPGSMLTQVASGLTQAMVSCPERVWPGYDWRKLQVLLVDPSKKQAVLWNDQRSNDAEVKITPLVWSDIPTSFGRSPGWYDFRTFNGKPTLGLVVTPSLAETIQRAIHEGFHFTGQDKFATPKLESFSRGQTYPIAWEPRYMRRQIVASLERALFESDTESLSAARYWYDRLHSQYDSDVRQRHDLDVIEGTAEYVGIIGTALASAGCKASEAELLARAEQFYRSKYPAGRTHLLYEDNESYQIGFLAGALLRQRGANGWHQQVTEVATPLDVLLKDVKPIEQKDDSKLLKTIKAYCDAQAQEIGYEIGSFIERMGYSNCYVVAIPDTWAVGSLSCSAFITASIEGKKRSFMIGVSGPLASPDKTVQGDFTNKTVERRIESPRGRESLFVFPMYKTSLQEKDGESHLNDPHMKLSGAKPEIVKDDKGREWLFVASYSPTSGN